MFKYFKALWYCVTGRFSAAAAALQENKYVMAASYDNAIDKSNQRFETIKNAVAELIVIETQRSNEIVGLGKDIDNLTKIKTGAQIAMQKRLDVLKSQGLSKDQILADTDFVRHNAAFNSTSESLQRKLEAMADKEKDLAERKKGIAQYKAELQKMQRSSEQLREEKQEALADVAISQQIENINSVLGGISTDSGDQDLASAREARKRATARAKVVSELAGNDSRLADNEYAEYAQTATSTSELDKLLNWGDKEEPKELGHAKLPE